MKILVVEDNPVNMLICQRTLEQHGMRVVQAADGIEALNAVQQAESEGDPVCAILMDIQMPRMGGIEASRILRRKYDGRALPIIALTASAFASDRDEVMAAGMTRFLAKPIEPMHVLATLKEVLCECVEA